MSNPSAYPWLAELACGQHSAVTNDQLRRAGLSRKQVRRRFAEGSLERTGVSVVRSALAAPSVLADVATFVLDCGEGAVASGPTGAALHEFDGFTLRPPFHATVPRGRCLERSPHAVHTTIALPPEDRTLLHGIPVMAVPRQLIDLARFVGAPTLTVAFDGALRDRKTTEDQLHARIAELRRSGRYGIPKLIDVIEGCEAMRGGHSWLERRFLQICARAGLPAPQRQQVVTDARGRMVRVDFAFSGTDVVVEVLGYRWHCGSRVQFNRDAERLNAIVRRGLRPVQFTYDHVTLEERWVATEVAAMLGLAVCVSGSALGGQTR